MPAFGKHETVMKHYIEPVMGYRMLRMSEGL